MDRERYHSVSGLYWSADHQSKVYHRDLLSRNRDPVCQHRDILGRGRNGGSSFDERGGGNGRSPSGRSRRDRGRRLFRGQDVAPF